MMTKGGPATMTEFYPRRLHRPLKSPAGRGPAVVIVPAPSTTEYPKLNAHMSARPTSASSAPAGETEEFEFEDISAGVAASPAAAQKSLQSAVLLSPASPDAQVEPFVAGAQNGHARHWQRGQWSFDLASLQKPLRVIALNCARAGTPPPLRRLTWSVAIPRHLITKPLIP